MWQPIDTTTGKRLTLKSSDWPFLVHGTVKSGSSFFTIALTADLIRHGQKVVCICARGEELRLLQKELNIDKSESTFSEVTSSAADTLENMQLVSLFKRKGVDVITSLRALKDWSERVVVINNVEDVLTTELWEILQTHTHYVLSGDFEKLPFEIDQQILPLQIFFSASPVHWRKQRSKLPSYIGEGYRGSEHFLTIVKEIENVSSAQLDKTVEL